MLKVKISRNYPYPNLLRQTPGELGIWDDIQFSEEEMTDADFIVIFNQPSQDLRIKSTVGGTWLILQEPPYQQNEYFKYHFRFVDRTISGFTAINNNENAQAGLPWHINKSYDDLLQLTAHKIEKLDRVSWITSNNNRVPGHQPRLDFINFLNENKFQFDLFGRGFEPIDDKYNALAQYKYSIAVENYSGKDYWTEKAIDCFLSWTMPIYCGCTNFADYFPEKSFIQIDINNPKAAIEIIKKAMDDNLWEKNIDFIREARDLVLNKYQMFPMIADRIRKFQLENPRAGKRIYRIPKSGLTKMEEFKKRIRIFFKA